LCGGEESIPGNMLLLGLVTIVDGTLPYEHFQVLDCAYGIDKSGMPNLLLLVIPGGRIANTIRIRILRARDQGHGCFPP
jgi:hypothetical protein